MTWTKTFPIGEDCWYWARPFPGRISGNTVLEIDTTPRPLLVVYGDCGELCAWGMDAKGAPLDRFEWNLNPIRVPE